MPSATYNLNDTFLTNILNKTVIVLPQLRNTVAEK